jgi:hypothetical protein
VFNASVLSVCDADASSASSFFENIDRFMAPDYVATYQDVLRARVRTTGIQESVQRRGGGEGR